MGGYENDQVLFGVLLDIAAKGSADERNVADDGSFIFHFLHVFAHQPAEDHRLPIINADACGHFARAEHGLVYDVRRELNRLGNRNSNSGVHAHCKNWAAVADEALKLHDLRNQIEINRRIVPADYWFDFQRHTSVSRIPSCRRRRRHNHRDWCRRLPWQESTGGGGDRWDLRWRICQGKTKLSYDFDNRALSALSGHSGRREQIDAFFL